MAKEIVYKVTLRYNRGTYITHFCKESAIDDAINMNEPADEIEVESTGRMSYN